MFKNVINYDNVALLECFYVFSSYLQPECNTPPCNSDAKDCNAATDPWKSCSEPLEGVHCRTVFNDTKCDPQCNKKECQYDGHDCERQVGTCNPHYDSYCNSRYANGECNAGCNTPACNWDGLDCTQEAEQLALGTLIIVVGVPPSEFLKMKKQFIRKLGNLLQAVLVLKKDKYGNDMVYPWYKDSRDKPGLQGRVKRSFGVTDPTHSGRIPEGYVLFVSTLSITNCEC